MSAGQSLPWHPLHSDAGGHCDLQNAESVRPLVIVPSLKGIWCWDEGTCVCSLQNQHENRK